MPFRCRHHHRERYSRRRDPQRRTPAHLARGLEAAKAVQICLVLAQLGIAIPISAWYRTIEGGHTACHGPGKQWFALSGLAITAYFAFMGKIAGGYKSVQFMKGAVVGDALCLGMQIFAFITSKHIASRCNLQGPRHRTWKIDHGGQSHVHDDAPSMPCMNLPKMLVIVSVFVAISYVHTLVRSIRLFASLRRQASEPTDAFDPPEPRRSNEKTPLNPSGTGAATPPGHTNLYDPRSIDGASVTSSTTWEEIYTPTSSTSDGTLGKY